MAQFMDLPGYREYSPDEMKTRAEEFCSEVRRRRTVRDFSDRPVSREIIEQSLLAAGSAPNGANLQPWHFVAVSNPAIKQKIREAAEEEERNFYQKRAPQDWLDALAPLGTDANKPFLDIAPWLIVIFMKTHDIRPDGTTVKHYYPSESVG
ncbi:MAG: nitroreductase family protein, partial [Verrucomicrobiota bacterium]